jgi:hypothetical protein
VLLPALAVSTEVVLVASTGANTEMRIGPVPSRQCWANAGSQKWAIKVFLRSSSAGTYCWASDVLLDCFGAGCQTPK